MTHIPILNLLSQRYVPVVVVVVGICNLGSINHKSDNIVRRLRRKQRNDTPWYRAIFKVRYSSGTGVCNRDSVFTNILKFSYSLNIVTKVRERSRLNDYRLCLEQLQIFLKNGSK